jgi:hypothetical protein
VGNAFGLAREIYVPPLFFPGDLGFEKHQSKQKSSMMKALFRVNQLSGKIRLLCLRKSNRLLLPQSFRMKLNIFLFVETLISVAVIGLLTGCAGVTHSRIAYKEIPMDPVGEATAKKINEENDRKAVGIRYYEASPYLLVYSDGKGGIVWKIYYLPDQTRKMTADPYNYIAKVTANMTFSHGVLSDSTTESDSTAVPKAIMAAVEKLLPLVLADTAPASRKVLPPSLYKIIVKGDGITLAGGPGNTEVNVTIKGEK